MHIRLMAVSGRQPAWIDNGFKHYADRLPTVWKFRLDIINTAARAKGSVLNAAREEEGARIMAKLRRNERLVALDERGEHMTSRELATALETWQTRGDDVVFLIGGPDGLAAPVLESADKLLSLSRLTMPHGLARVLFAEQLYRAWSMMAGHPYHRD